MFKKFTILILFLFSCKENTGFTNPKPMNGVIDLREWDFDSKGAIKLNGEWEFYFKQFLIPDDFENGKQPSQKLIKNIPSTWNDFIWEDEKIKSDGYATYRLKILLKKDYTDRALLFSSFSTASRIWIDGKGIFASGKVAREEKEHQPSSRNGYFHFPVDKEELEILIQVSNFSDFKGGLDSEIYFGTEEQIRKQREANLFSDLFLFGILSSLSIYNLVIFIFRRKDHSAIYYSLFCIIVSLFIGTQREKILYEYLSIPWLINNKLYFLSYILIPNFLYLYTYALFELQYKKWILRVSYFISILYLILVLISSPKYYSKFELTYLYFESILSFILLLILFLECYKNYSKDVILYSIGFIVLYFTFTLDKFEILQKDIFLSTPELGLIFFSLVQAGLLAKKFSQGFLTSENLSKKLTVQNNRLIALDKMKDEFLSNTSHELRTPIHGIIGIAESLVDGVTGELQKTTKQNLSLIIKSGKRLSNLINDILDFSKLKNKELVLKEKTLDIKMIIELVIALSSSLLKNKEVNIINELPDNLPLVVGDEDRIQQIFLNIIGNSIKFTEQGEIKITGIIKADEIEISVSDTGIGIPEDKLENIFLSFEQVDSSISRKYGGTGIGLSIVKKLIELQGGRVWAESQLGKGTKIYTSFKISNSNIEENSNRIDELNSIIDWKEDIHITENSIHTEQGVKILLVDDEPINLQILENQLKLNQYQILRASDGIEALKIIDIEKPDLVLLDVMMPKLSGYETCKKIREKYSETELPILMLTAKNRLEDLMNGFAVGANDYLAKPFSKGELLSRIKSHLNLLKTNRSTRRFFPQEYLDFFSKESILDIQKGDHISKEMSVVFSDIRSFTTLSEKMTPAENFNFVNSYFSRITPIISNNKGVVVKFLGDGMMSIFPDSVKSSIDSSIEHLNLVTEYNQHRIKKSREPIQVGIGIHFGKMMVGLVGDTNRLQGDAFSDQVNLAARIEGLTKYYGASILISETIYSQIQNDSVYKIRFVDKVKVKGKTEAIRIYEILNGNSIKIEKKILTKDIYTEAVFAYYQTELKLALELFEKAQSIDSEDMAVQVFINRTKYFLKYGIPEDWDGIYKMESK
jgi:signal transduction histidine kinase/DNA-binding response OmpR family regulator